jgi:hypothetical protein
MLLGGEFGKDCVSGDDDTDTLLRAGRTRGMATAQHAGDTLSSKGRIHVNFCLGLGWLMRSLAVPGALGRDRVEDDRVAIPLGS